MVNIIEKVKKGEHNGKRKKNGEHNRKSHHFSDFTDIVSMFSRTRVGVHVNLFTLVIRRRSVQ